MRLALCTMTIVTAMTPTTWGQTDKDNDEGRKERLALMERLMDQVEVFAGSDKLTVKRIERPLMRHHDASRNYTDGTLWAFGTQGRPVVMMILQPDSSLERRWWHAATSLSPAPIGARRQGATVWATDEPGLSFSPLSEEPPATSKPRRLAQMRKIAARFTAHQFWNPDNQRFELRLLRQPVYRYDDDRKGIIDGSIFGFMINVHPELLLVIEAIRENGQPTWRYAFVKIGSAEFHAKLGDKEVYESPRAPGVLGRPTDAYRMFASYTSAE